MKKILNEQSPSSADCSMLQSVMDPNIFDAICAAQCSGNTGGFGNNIALLNIASCCECSEEPSEPTPPSAEDSRALLCRRLMDDIIPNDFDMTGEAWCKKNCKDVYSIVMVDVGGKEINGCKCCSRLDVVGPKPQEPEMNLSDWLDGTTWSSCEPGTTYAPSDDNIGTGDDQMFLNLEMTEFNSLPCYGNLQNYYNGPQQGNALNQYQEFPDGYPSQYAMWIAYGEGGNNWSNGGWPDDIICGQAQTYCDNRQGNTSNQSNLTSYHENFQNLCCEGTSTLINDLNENKTLSESLVKRLRKLANIKNKK